MDNVYEISIVLCELGNPRLINSFLRSILTNDEIRMISKRWELSKMLEKGESQRDISTKLGVSLCKITRGSKELKKRNSALKKALGFLRISGFSSFWTCWAV